MLVLVLLTNMHDLSYIDTTSGPFKTLHSVPQACGCSIENILEYILNLSRCPGMSAQSKIKIRWHSNHCSHLISKTGNSVEMYTVLTTVLTWCNYTFPFKM